jgi:glutathione S-transferase
LTTFETTNHEEMTMKLYFSPGACSLSPHITAREAGIELALERVDTKSKRTKGGADFLAINPKGYVPALELDDGEVLTEGPVVVQYLADLRPASRLAPPNGTMARYRLQEALGYINSEIHKTYSPLFSPTTSPDVRAEKEATLKKRYALFEAALDGKTYLFGDDFTVADAYLFTVTNWAPAVKVDLSQLVNLAAFQKRVAERPAVQAAMKAEGLLR